MYVDRGTERQAQRDAPRVLVCVRAYVRACACGVSVAVERAETGTQRGASMGEARGLVRVVEAMCGLKGLPWGCAEMRITDHGSSVPECPAGYVGGGSGSLHMALVFLKRFQAIASRVRFFSCPGDAGWLFRMALVRVYGAAIGRLSMSGFWAGFNALLVWQQFLTPLVDAGPFVLKLYGICDVYSAQARREGRARSSPCLLGQSRERLHDCMHACAGAGPRTCHLDGRNRYRRYRDTETKAEPTRHNYHKETVWGRVNHF